MTCINKMFEVKDSGRSCLALKFNLINPRTTILSAKYWFKVVRFGKSYIVFFGGSIQTIYFFLSDFLPLFSIEMIEFSMPPQTFLQAPYKFPLKPSILNPASEPLSLDPNP